MRKLLTILLILISTTLMAQTKPSYLQLVDTPTLDFRLFGARAVSGFDNATAFASAAAYITANGGNMGLLIPSGTFEVEAGGTATASGSRVLWSCFELDGIDNVKIIGAPGSKITSTLNMGSSTTDGQCMWLFDFNNCNDIVIEDLTVDITVIATPDPLAVATASPAVCKLAAIVYATADGEAIDGLSIRNCDLKIHCSSGNGAKKDYEFMTINVNGDWSSPYTYSYSGVEIDNCLFRYGQGPEVWLWFVQGARITNCRWNGSGGPLYPIRMTPACSDVLIEGNQFTMKHQPNQSSTYNHNFPIHCEGGSVWDTTTTTAARNISVIGNKFRTLGGQAAYFGGGKNIVFSGNTVERASTDTGDSFSGCITINDSQYDEPADNVVISGNTVSGCPDSAIRLYGLTSDVSIANNVIASCSNGLIMSTPAYVSNLVIEGNAFRSCASEAIYISTVATGTGIVTINGNSFQDNGLSCVRATSPCGCLMLISGNIFKENGTQSTPTLNTGYGSQNIIGNYFRGNGGIDVICNPNNLSPNSGSMVTGNYFEGSGLQSIYVDGSYVVVSGNNIVNGNQAAQPGIAGIEVNTGANQILISGNNIIDNGAGLVYGILIASATESLVTGNLLYNAATTEISSGTSGVETTNNFY